MVPTHADHDAEVSADAAVPANPQAMIEQALGGPLGIAESSAPAVAFIIATSIADLEPTTSAIIAAAIGAVFTVARIVRRETPQFAVAGLAGLALAAFIVSRTGNAEDFFLPGLLINAGYATAWAISILVRWPLIGLVLETATGQGSQWRHDDAKRKSYARVSWLWVGLFSLRLAVQLPLYLAGAVAALGVARVAMGIPLFVVTIWISWRMLGPLISGPRIDVSESAPDPDPAPAAPPG